MRNQSLAVILAAAFATNATAQAPAAPAPESITNYSRTCFVSDPVSKTWRRGVFSDKPGDQVDTMVLSRGVLKNGDEIAAMIDPGVTVVTAKVRNMDQQGREAVEAYCKGKTKKTAGLETTDTPQAAYDDPSAPHNIF